MQDAKANLPQMAIVFSAALLGSVVLFLLASSLVREFTNLDHGSSGFLGGIPTAPWR
jgi:hypothetical protein